MQTASEFDLNNAIQPWRAALARTAAFRAENLDELESHLRDSVIALTARGLSSEEAFFIAVRRTGKNQELAAEFGKVNSHDVWMDRLLWMLIGLQVWAFVSGLITFITGNALFYGFYSAGYDFQAHGRVIPSMVSTVVQLAGIAGSLALCWWVLCRKGQRVVPWLERMLQRRSTLTLLFSALFLLSLSERVITGGTTALLVRAFGQGIIGEYYVARSISFAILQLVSPAVFVGLTLFLARKRLRLSQA